MAYKLCKNLNDWTKECKKIIRCAQVKLHAVHGISKGHVCHAESFLSTHVRYIHHVQKKHQVSFRCVTLRKINQFEWKVPKT